MWSTSGILIVCLLLFGILGDVKEVSSQARVIQVEPAEDTDRVKEEIQNVIKQIQSLSGRGEKTRSFTASPAGEAFFIDTYYGTLSNLVALVQQLQKDGFMDNLPKTLVCILSGQQDCGVEGELTQTVAADLVQPLLAFLASLKTQTCVPVNKNYRGLLDSMATAFDGFQETLIKILSSIPGSGNLMSTLSYIADAALANVSTLMASLLQVPVDYIKIALQFAIRVPTFNEETETCEEGDLKQLILWGMKHNISWSFTPAIVDILLEFLLNPRSSSCLDPGCNDPTFVFSEPPMFGKTLYSHDVLYQCNQRDLARVNETLCADILSGERAAAPSSVVTLCQALFSLSPDQIEHMWSNMCYVFQALLAPLLTRTPYCGEVYMQPFPAFSPPSETITYPAPIPQRVAREAPNLRQLACNYNVWMENQSLDPVLVSLCGDNDRVAFVQRVCNNAALMKKLLKDPTNQWLYGYCANFSADPAYLVTHFCTYMEWANQPMVKVEAPLVEMCMKLDGTRLKRLLCQHTMLFMLLFSNPANFQFMPNCTLGGPLPPPPPPPSQVQAPLTGMMTSQSCDYAQWHDLTKITAEVILQCIRLDPDGFTQKVCFNSTFLNSLLRDERYSWVRDHCSVSLGSTPAPNQPLNIPHWCNYSTWGQRQVDTSVVGLCWQNDQQAFQKNVCCMPSVLDMLLQQPHNQWLATVCADLDDMLALPGMCNYSDWSNPIMVDMTEAALCAEIDPLNFTSKVCTDETVLQNLLANQDNDWLIQHCANHTRTGVSPAPGGEAGPGDGLSGISPARLCRYSSWAASPPNVSLLTLCWEHDQARFVSAVCTNTILLVMFSKEPSSKWVSSMCNTYTNYTTVTVPTTTTSENPDYCLASHLVKQLNLNCSADFTIACGPGANQNMVLRMVVLCWMESLKPRVGELLTPPVSAVLEQAVTTTVVFSLAIEEYQNNSKVITNNIRLIVLETVADFMEKEKNFDKKRVLLQCFGTILTRMIKIPRDMSNNQFYVIKEYFNIPLSNLRAVLSGANLDTVRLILLYYGRNKHTVQVSDEYLATMVSVFFQIHLVQDESLFPLLAPLLPSASPTDILALHTLKNREVWNTINTNMDRMTPDQREAFGLWYGKALSSSEITSGRQSLVVDTGNVIAYLPFHIFQHLSPAQLLNGLGVLQKNTLAPLKQEFVAHSIISTYKNLTAQDFLRLGELTCLADPKDLLSYKDTEAYSVIQELVLNCTRKGLDISKHLVATLLLNDMEFKVPASLSRKRLEDIVHLLPLMGVTFLQGLTPTQLLNVLPALGNVSFSPVQASVIVDKLSSVTRLTAADKLENLGSLTAGMQAEELLKLTSGQLLQFLPSLAHHSPCRSPPQAIAIATKLWGYPQVVTWLDNNDVDPLLYCTPLMSVLPRIPVLVNMTQNITTNPFNTQQAKDIFTKALDIHPNLIKENILKLGTLGQGLSCQMLKEYLQDDTSLSGVRKVLIFLQQQTRPLHISLKKCVIEELYQLPFFSQLLRYLSTEISLSMPLSVITKFTKADMDILRKTIIQEPHHFLLLPRSKQTLLVDKMVERMNMNTGSFTGEEFQSLRIMAPFVADEVFSQIDRSFFLAKLPFLLGLCYTRSKMSLVAAILQEPVVFGPTKKWNYSTVLQVDRFLFFLSDTSLQDISLDLVPLGYLEKLFIKQRHWESGDVGANCLTEDERISFFQRQQFVLQFFLGYLKIDPHSSWSPFIPSCAVMHSIPPAAWTPSSLLSMSSVDFYNCLELMGRDPYIANYQRSQLLNKVKKIFGPVFSFSQPVISQLGALAKEMTEEELSSLHLVERRSIAALGAVQGWSQKQLAVLSSRVFNSTKQTPIQLDSSTLVAMGHILCGAKSTNLSSLNAVEFSKAALFLGQLQLACSEEQLEVFVRLLTHPLAFGPISSWGTGVFIEIGVLAAGITDFAMSALVREQIEGMTPEAISRIPPERFYVALNQRQISMFSYEQAAAVTNEQYNILSEVQKTALSMALTPWENRPVDFRGRSGALSLSHSPVCLTLGLLMLLFVLHGPAQ